jgi:hypothetical protein
MMHDLPWNERLGGNNLDAPDGIAVLPERALQLQGEELGEQSRAHLPHLVGECIHVLPGTDPASFDLAVQSLHIPARAPLDLRRFEVAEDQVRDVELVLVAQTIAVAAVEDAQLTEGCGDLGRLVGARTHRDRGRDLRRLLCDPHMELERDQWHLTLARGHPDLAVARVGRADGEISVLRVIRCRRIELGAQRSDHHEVTPCTQVEDDSSIGIDLGGTTAGRHARDDLDQLPRDRHQHARVLSEPRRPGHLGVEVTLDSRRRLLGRDLGLRGGEDNARQAGLAG